MNSLKVILVRHGLSTYNQQGKYQGCSDESLLTTKGLKAAYQTGLALQDYHFDRIYTSPLQRAKKTTEEIVKVFSNHHSSEIIIDDRLKEVNMSPWEGLTYQYVKSNFPQAYQCWLETPHLFSFFQGEEPFFPILELYHRAELFWQDILKESSQKTILIVAHGGTNRALISTALGLSYDKYHGLQQSNCGISCLEFKDRKYVNLDFFNSTIHLGEKLPKLKEGNQGLRYIFVNKESENLNKLINFLELNNLNLDNLPQDYPLDFCQNILTHDEEIKKKLYRDFFIKTINNYLYIIHELNTNKKILQGIISLKCWV